MGGKYNRTGFQINLAAPLSVHYYSHFINKNPAGLKLNPSAGSSGYELYTICEKVFNFVLFYLLKREWIRPYNLPNFVM